MLAGWGGLAAIVWFALPFVWARWGFFVTLMLAVTGTSLPVVYFLHLRFPPKSPAAPRVLVRQASWVGSAAVLLAWLQLGRLVNLYVLLGVAGGALALEYLMRMRDTAESPALLVPDDEDDAAEPASD